jgi:hypothetical protein
MLDVTQPEACAQAICQSFSVLAKEKPHIVGDFEKSFENRSKFAALLEGGGLSVGLKDTLCLIFQLRPMVFHLTNFDREPPRGVAVNLYASEIIARLHKATLALSMEQPAVLVRFGRGVHGLQIPITRFLGGLLVRYSSNERVYPF